MAFPLFAPRRAVAAGGGEPLTHTESASVSRPPLARGREVAALLLWTAAVFLLLALASYAGDPAATTAAAEGAPPPLSGPNWVGPVGASCARAVVTIIGATAWVIPLELALLGVPFVRGKRSLITPARLAIDFLVVVIAASLVQVGWPGKLAFGMHPASGARSRARSSRPSVRSWWGSRASVFSSSPERRSLSSP
jgi:hypothetical protein